MIAVDTLARDVGIAPACRAVLVSRASWYRRQQPRKLTPAPRPRHHRAHSDDERRSALSQLHSKRFVDVAPGEVHAILLDEGIYLGSVRFLYRLLADADAVRERRNQLRHPVYTKPELLATEPGRVWSWDITKLRGPVPGMYFHLYVIEDLADALEVVMDVA